MPTFEIESSGRIERTAVYYNGEQLGGIREIFLNMDEDGTFDAIIQYEGSDKEIYTKSIFEEYLDNIKTVEPSFTEEEARMLRKLTIDSDGDIEDTLVLINDAEEFGIVEILLHIKVSKAESGIKNWLKSKKNLTEKEEFRAEIIYRNEDDSLETENIF